MALRHTYSSKRRVQPYPSSRNTSPVLTCEVSTPDPSSSRSALKRAPLRTLDNQKPRPSKLKPRTDKKGKAPAKQLFFDITNPMRSCRLCGLSYTAGLPDDELLHKRHCGRVTRGLEWNKGEEKEAARASLRVVEEFVPLKESTERGRIIAIDCLLRGKIGSKVSAILDMINLCLSAPSLATGALERSRIYLFLLPPRPGSSKERIVGAIVLTRIEQAMRVARRDSKPDDPSLVMIDSGLYCYPEQVPAAIGVSRIFVSTTFRRQGIATALLQAGAKTFVHGCPLRFEDGGIAFSQPTGSGQRLMESIGSGYIGIYEE